MRAIALVAIGTVILLAASCNKSKTSPDPTSEDLKLTEALLSKYYSQAKQYEGLLVDRHKTPGMTMMDNMQNMVNNMQAMRKVHIILHK